MAETGWGVAGRKEEKLSVFYFEGGSCSRGVVLVFFFTKNRSVMIYFFVRNLACHM